MGKLWEFYGKIMGSRLELDHGVTLGFTGNHPFCGCYNPGGVDIPKVRAYLTSYGGMVFAAPADLVSLKVALFRMEKREKARPAFIGGKAPAAKLASVFEGFDHPAAVTPASARPLVTSPTPSVPVTPTLATPGTGQAMQPEDGAAKSAPGEKGTAAAKTASATDTAKSKKRKPSPSGERRSSHSHHHTHAHGHGSSHR
ncbi:hypothetical protein PAPYR_7930 [Paratrimastix pyriformis]|uniref:Uncharacterized protein n=1 Tax=Paratrimastix pyriformis TaxID=342808 RepID=A0ABQ8UFS7_9EUKA|nr:hypothetical protein PAPYR_7930 [Paratrimastix pyriformis]